MTCRPIQAAIPPTLLTLLAAAHAQCQPNWTGGGALNGPNSSVACLVEWDPDGAGPATPVLVVGGQFSHVTNLRVDGLALFDPATGQWSALGNGFNAPLSASVVMPNGDLVVAGLFTSTGSTPAERVARWDGSTWQPIGNGLNDDVNALGVLASGELVAGGEFTGSGTTALDHVAIWDGTAWQPLGFGLDNEVFELEVLVTGELFARGSFQWSGPQATPKLAAWDGVAWHGVPGAGPGIGHLQGLPTGDLVVAGQFSSMGGMAATNFARWDGAAWHALSTSLPSELSFMAQGIGPSPSGGLVAHGIADGLFHWDGANWSLLATGARSPFTSNVNGALWLLSHNLLTPAQGSPLVTSHVARWDGSQWYAAGAGWLGSPRKGIVTTNGDVIVGAGRGDLPGSKNITRYDGSAWHALGTGVEGFFPNLNKVASLHEMPNGDVVVGGSFDFAGGVPAQNIARWDGNNWHPLGAGLTPTLVGYVGASDLALAPNGDLIVCGRFTAAGGSPAQNVARWDGVAWHAMGAGTMQDPNAVAVLPDGRVVVTGGAFSVYPRVEIYDGSTWQPMGMLAGTGRELVVQSDGTLVIAMQEGNPGVLRWDGVDWQQIGNFAGAIHSMTLLPNDDLVVTGNFNSVNGSPAASPARWDGTGWTSLAPGGVQLATVFDTAVGADKLVLLGNFLEVAGIVTPCFAERHLGCPPAVTPIGVGCPGSGGSGVLTAVPPWLGSTWTATATGLPANAIALTVYGFAPLSQSLALSTVFAQAGPGCDLLITPDIVEASLAVAGVARSSVTWPDAPALIGAQLYEQMVPCELGGAGALLDVTTTNAIVVTLGVFE